MSERSEQREFIATKHELLAHLWETDDREVMRVAENWHELEQDREAQPSYYIELLERWSRSMLLRLQTYLENTDTATLGHGDQTDRKEGMKC